MTDTTSSSIPAEAEALKLVPPESDAAASLRARRAKALTTRVWCLFTCALCFSMLGMGLYLKPDPRGTGTHQQLGLPPCGFLAVTGYPCPTCGCTTAVSHFSHGQILASFLTQPFGFTVALVALVAGCLALVGVVTGKWVGPSMFYLSWHWRIWFFGGIGMLAFGWAYKIMMMKMGAS